MKKLLFVLASISLISYSCKKSTNVAPAFTKGISATINGKDQTFNFAVSATNTQSVGSGGGYVFMILGANSASNTSAISISVITENPITEGTYNFDATNSTNVPPYFYYFYTISPDLSRHTYTTRAAPYTGTVTITSISRTNVKGTFSGSLYELYTGYNDPIVTIANGKFDIDFE